MLKDSTHSLFVVTTHSDKRTIYTYKQEISVTGKSARITNIVDFIDTEKFYFMGFNTIRATGENIEFINKMQKKNMIVLQIKNMYKILLLKLQGMMKLFFGMKILIMG